MADIQSNINLNIDTTEALASIRALQSQISAFHRTLAKGGASANAQSSQMQQNLINTINKTGAYSASMTKVASTTESFTNALEKNKLTMGQTFKYSMATTKTFGKFFRSEFDTISKTARERVKDLQTQYIRLGRDASGAMNAIQVRPLALDMKNYGTQTAIAAQKQQIFNKLITQGSTNLLNWGKNTQWAGRQLMVGFTIPLAMMGAAAAKSFMDIEKEIIKIRRVYGDFTTTVQETDKAIDSLKNLANEFTKYGVAVKDTLELAGDFAAAGNQGSKLLAQVREASRLAVLGNVSQQEAFEATISVTNAFGVAAEDLAGKIDFLNAVENQSVTSIEDLTIAIPKAGPVIRQLGGDVEDLAFFLTAMKEGGINASEGANALKSGLASLINPSEKSAEFLRQLGINIKGIVEGNAGDIKGTVVGFAQALDTLDPLNRARAIEQLFGKFQFSRISTLFQNVIDQGSQANRVLQLTRASSEELAILSERELKRVESSPVFKFQKAMQDFQTALAPVGEQFLKAITPLIEFGSKLLEQFNGMSDGAKSFAVVAVAAIGGIGPILLMVIGLIANAAANIIKFVNFVRGRFQNTAGEVGVLGSQTEYLTQAQIKAMSAAASLQQAHNTLTQQFTSEIGAIQSLIAAYNQAITAQNRFAAAAAPAKALTITTNARGGRRVIAPQGYASGVLSVPGPKGAGDVVPAMLSPGEAVIPAKPAKKYAPFIQDMISGNIPGFMRGVFLGMPKSSKAVSKNREAGQQIYDLFKQSSFAKTPPTAYGHQIAPTTGHSFPIFGLGGVYQKGNKRVFVKPVMDEKAALAEMRATQIAREAHGLESPKQRIVVMKDPADLTGQRKFLALESDLDPKFVNNSPLGVFNEKQYFKQLTASLLRADKDLSASNVYRNVVADVGPAGVFDRASGLRDYAKRLPSMEEQALVNLLGVKGGAKKAFAESTKGLMSGLTPEKYHQRMISEIQETLPKLKNTIASFNLKDPRDIGVYADMVKRLESGLNVDWRKFHTIHSSVTIPKPKVPKNVDSSELLRQYQSGTASVAPLLPSEKILSSILNSPNLNSESKQTVASYFSAKDRSRRTVPASLQILENLTPGLGREVVEKLASLKVGGKDTMKIVSGLADFVSVGPEKVKSAKDVLFSELDSAAKNSNGKISNSASITSKFRSGTGWKPNNAGATAFAHLGGGKKLTASEILALNKSGQLKLSSNEIKVLESFVKNNPAYQLDLKTGLGMGGIPQSLNAKLDRGTASKLDLLSGLRNAGITKWQSSVGLGGGKFADLEGQLRKLDSEFEKIIASQPDDTIFADSEETAKKLRQQGKKAISLTSVYGAARSSLEGSASNLFKVLDSAHSSATEVRASGDAVDKVVAQSGVKKNPFVSPGKIRSLKSTGLIPALKNVSLQELLLGRRGFRFASGVVSVPGPKGAGDVVPAMLSPGEAVIPTKMAKKYSPLINAMIGGNIPGYFDGKLAPPKLDTSLFGTSSEQIAGASPSQRKTFGNAIGTGFGKTREVTRALASSTTRVLKDVVVGNMDKNTGVLGKLGRSVAIGLGNIAGNTVVDSKGNVLNKDGAAKSAAAAGANSATRPPMIIGGNKTQADSDETNSRKGRGGARVSGAASLVGMGAMMYGMSGGPGAEMAMMASMPLMMAPMIAPMLANPVGIIVAALAAVTGGALLLNNAFNDAAKAAREQAFATGASSQAMQAFAEFSGKVTSGEIMDERRSEALTQFGVQSGKESFGNLFIQSEAAQPIIKALSSSLEKSVATGDMSSMIAATTNQLVSAVAVGALSRDEAASVAAAFAEEIGDTTFGIKVIGEINELIGVDGSNILKDPIGIRVKLLQQSNEELQSQMGIAPNTSSIGLSADVAAGGGSLVALGGTVAATASALKAVAIAGAAATAATGGIAAPVAAIVVGLTAAGLGAWQAYEGLKASGEAAGLVVASGTMALEQNKQLLDSLELEYQKRIDIAAAAGNLLEVGRLEDERNIGRKKILDEQKRSMDLISESYAKEESSFLGFFGKNIVGEALDRQIDEMYKDDPRKQMVTTAARKGIEASAGTEDQELRLKLMLSTGDIDPGSMMNLMKVFGQDQESLQKIINIQTNLGGADAGRAFALANLFEGEGAEAKQATFIATIEAESKSPEEASKLLEMFEIVQQTGGILKMSTVLDTYMANPDAGTKLAANIEKFRKEQEKGPIDIKVVQTIFGQEAFGQVLKNHQMFSQLDPYNQIVYLTTFQAAWETVGYDDKAYQLWAMQNKDRLGFDISKSAYAAAQAQKAVDSQIRINPVSAEVDEAIDSGGGGGSSGRESSTFLDDIVKKIRNLRDETLKLPQSLEEAIASINKFGEQSSAGFNGLSDSIRNAGGSAEFINIALSATEEELAQIFQNGQLTALGKNLERSLGRISLGNFVEQQKSATTASKNQVAAFKKLTAAGVSVANAQQMIQDADLVAGLTAAGATAEDAQKAINAWMKAQKEGRKVLSKAEQTIERESLNIGVLSANIREFQSGLNVIQLQEDDINKKYDERLEALDRVQEANESIARQQQAQLSLADALSKGDIAAAARAMQQTKEQSAQNALQQQRTAIEKAREKDLDSIQVKVNGKLLNREEIQKRISDLQKQIAQIELEQMSPAQRLIAEQERDAYQQISDNFRAPTPPASAAPAPTPAPQPANRGTYTVVRGDTLSKISKQYYGDANKWRKIYDANKGVIGSNPNLIYPGQVYTIPLAAGGMVPTQKYAMGGKVSYYPMGGMIPYKAMGGMFKTVNTDSIPAMLTPGEFVIRRSAVERFGQKNLEKINNGMADSMSSVYNYSVNVSVKSDANPDQIAQSVMRQIKQIDSQRIRGNRF